MVHEETKTEGFKKMIKKKQGKIYDNVVKNYNKTVESGTEFIKSQACWESLKNNSLKIKEKSLEQGIILKNNSPRFYKKIVNAFFYFFELLVGRIKIGTQYGAANLEILERLAKLKELGILTDEEFTQKKKQILDKI
ncbi:MAG TPA: SHOCT domain-containing protein [Nitrosopumilus sp.]|nr:SHOCT domain-containing protein [Thermoproteota archaeon]HJJ23413.1 SHOCT domain-containing protein [Nitrosopumilus sp.]